MTDPTPIPVPIDTDHPQGRFYFLEPSRWNDGIGHGLQFANASALCRPGMRTVDRPNGDPDQYPERPHLVHVPAEGGLPRDLEVYASIWIVSQALKDVFDAVDPQGFAFAACALTLADGTPGPQHYLCDVIRELDALDRPASQLTVKVEHDPVTGHEVDLYSIAGGASLVFKQEAVGGVHIFRQPNSGFGPICDRAMFDALNCAALDGVRLRHLRLG